MKIIKFKKKEKFKYKRKVIIKDLILNISIGIHNFEKKKRQRVKFNIEILTNPYVTPNNKNLNSILNYEEIVNLVIKFVNTESYDLIETLAKQISEQIVFKYTKNESMFQEIKVTVHKPDTILKDRTEGISVSYREEFK